MISESDLRLEILRTLNEYTRALESELVYMDSSEHLMRLMQEPSQDPEQVEIARSNFSEYYRRIIQNGLTHTKLSSLVELYKKYFPENNLSGVERLVDNFSEERKREEDKLVQVISTFTGLFLYKKAISKLEKEIIDLENNQDLEPK